MRVVIVGAGGVGGYVGGRLVRAGCDVSLVGRGPHLAAIQRHGLSISDPDGDVTVSIPAGDTPPTDRPADLVIIAVKSNHTADVLDLIRPVVSDQTAVLSLQNGVDNEFALRDAFGEAPVMGGAAFIFSVIQKPGHVRRAPGPARIVFGELHGEESARTTRFEEVFRGAGIDVVVSANIEGVLWEKLAFICAQAGLTAACDRPAGVIRETAPTRAMFGRIVDEVVGVGRAHGVGIGPDVRERHLALLDQLDPGAHSSLHYDMTHGKTMELEYLHGSVVRRAAGCGVPVPMTEAVYAILKPAADGR